MVECDVGMTETTCVLETHEGYALGLLRVNATAATETDTPDHLVIVLDVSGSMCDAYDGHDALRRGAYKTQRNRGCVHLAIEPWVRKQFLEPEKHSLTIIKFETFAQTIHVNPQNIVVQNDIELECEVANILSQLRAYGGTCFARASLEMKNIVQTFGKESFAVLFLTDGCTHEQDWIQAHNEWHSALQDRKRRGLFSTPFFVLVGVGGSHDSDVLTGFLTNKNGYYVRTPTSILYDTLTKGINDIERRELSLPITVSIPSVLPNLFTGTHRNIHEIPSGMHEFYVANKHLEVEVNGKKLEVQQRSVQYTKFTLDLNMRYARDCVNQMLEDRSPETAAQVISGLNSRPSINDPEVETIRSRIAHLLETGKNQNELSSLMKKLRLLKTDAGQRQLELEYNEYRRQVISKAMDVIHGKNLLILRQDLNQLGFAEKHCKRAIKTLQTQSQLDERANSILQARNQISSEDTSVIPEDQACYFSLCTAREAVEGNIPIYMIGNVTGGNGISISNQQALVYTYISTDLVDHNFFVMAKELSRKIVDSYRQEIEKCLFPVYYSQWHYNTTRRDWEDRYSELVVGNSLTRVSDKGFGGMTTFLGTLYKNKTEHGRRLLELALKSFQFKLAEKHPAFRPMPSNELDPQKWETVKDFIEERLRRFVHEPHLHGPSLYINPLTVVGDALAVGQENRLTDPLFLIQMLSMFLDRAAKIFDGVSTTKEGKALLENKMDMIQVLVCGCENDDEFQIRNSRVSAPKLNPDWVIATEPVFESNPSSSILVCEFFLQNVAWDKLGAIYGTTEGPYTFFQDFHLNNAGISLSLLDMRAICVSKLIGVPFTISNSLTILEKAAIIVRDRIVAQERARRKREMEAQAGLERQLYVFDIVLKIRDSYLAEPLGTHNNVFRNRFGSFVIDSSCLFENVKNRIDSLDVCAGTSAMSLVGLNWHAFLNRFGHGVLEIDRNHVVFV